MVVCLVLLFLSLGRLGCSNEFTFELPNRKTECFFEEIQKDTKCIVDFQVISGGNYDVDCKILGPEGKEFYSTQRSKYDTVEFVAETTGEYQLCFSNEFSSLSHKTVYFEFVIGDEPPLTKDIGDHQVALTLLETSVTKIHEALRVIDNYQKHHRVREAQGKSAANHLNLRVQYWSIGEAVLFVVIALLEVFILRQFFATKRTTI